jgi:SMP-30/Gluconolactonase/LRE-like region
MTETLAPSRRSQAAPQLDAAPGFEVYAPEFEAVLGSAPRLVQVAETDAHEGPVYVPGEDTLYFTTVPQAADPSEAGEPRAAIRRLALDGCSFPVGPSRLSTLPAPVHMPNGMTLGHDGRLVVCEQGTRSERARISRVDPRTGRVDTIVDSWGGLPLNSPNDVAVRRRDGTIWFTDPSYGYRQGFRPEPRVGDYVYRFDPGSGRLSVVADSFDKPNGLAFSPDEQTLYVTDSGANDEPGPQGRDEVRARRRRVADRWRGVLRHDRRRGRGRHRRAQGRYGRQPVRVRPIRPLAALPPRRAPGHRAAPGEPAQPRLGRR